MSEKVTTILCSGVALGVYIPAILVDYQLKGKNKKTEVIVLENLLLEQKRDNIPNNKKAFHQSFRVALAGQKLSKDLWPLFDKNILNKMLEQWNYENRKNFIVFSGFWMPVIMEYLKRYKVKDINVDIVHMDADISASWKNFKSESEQFNNIWLFNWKEKKLEYEIKVNDDIPLRFEDRQDRFVIHGGGWGMGTYQNKISPLEQKGFKLDIVAYNYSETKGLKDGNRAFMINPDWNPWIKNSDNVHEFPPFAQIKEGEETLFSNKKSNHSLYDVIRESKGIISKPGGATLLDSLSSATPIIMLDPFGEYEQKNSELWECLGYGITYDKWKESDYSVNLLEKLHQNILKANGTLINYTDDYCKRDS